MIFDNTNLFSDGQAVTATAGSTNTIALTPIASGVVRDIGKGCKIPLRVQVTEAFNNLTSLKIDIEMDSTETFTPDKTVTLGTFLLAELVAGFVIPWDIIPNGINMNYMRLKYTVTGTAPTTGKITAGIVAAVPSNG